MLIGIPDSHPALALDAWLRPATKVPLPNGHLQLEWPNCKWSHRFEDLGMQTSSTWFFFILNRIFKISGGWLVTGWRGGSLFPKLFCQFNLELIGIRYDKVRTLPRSAWKQIFLARVFKGSQGCYPISWEIKFLLMALPVKILISFRKVVRKRVF